MVSCDDPYAWQPDWQYIRPRDGQPGQAQRRGRVRGPPGNRRQRQHTQGRDREGGGVERKQMNRTQLRDDDQTCQRRADAQRGVLRELEDGRRGGQVLGRHDLGNDGLDGGVEERRTGGQGQHRHARAPAAKARLRRAAVGSPPPQRRAPDPQPARPAADRADRRTRRQTAPRPARAGSSAPAAGRFAPSDPVTCRARKKMPDVKQRIAEVRNHLPQPQPEQGAPPGRAIGPPARPPSRRCNTRADFDRRQRRRRSVSPVSSEPIMGRIAPGRPTQGRAGRFCHLVPGGRSPIGRVRDRRRTLEGRFDLRAGQGAHAGRGTRRLLCRGPASTRPHRFRRSGGRSARGRRYVSRIEYGRGGLLGSKFGATIG